MKTNSIWITNNYRIEKTDKVFIIEHKDTIFTLMLKKTFEWVEAWMNNESERFITAFEEARKHAEKSEYIAEQKLLTVIDDYEEEKVPPEVVYGFSIEKLSKELMDMGKDVIADWKHDNPNYDSDDLESFIQSSSGEIAENVYGNFCLDHNKKQFLKAKNILDITGWAADYIADGMRN